MGYLCMSLFGVLRSSFELLFERPELFVPRLFSSLLTSFLLVSWILGWIDVLILMGFMPLVTLVGAFTPVMVSSMVEKKEAENGLLWKGLKESLALWKEVLGFTVLTFVLAFVNSLPLSIGLSFSLVTGNFVYAVLGGAMSFLMLLGISWGFYFVPISLVKEKKFFEGVENALGASSRNRKEVLILIIFSLAVLGAASLTTGYLRDIGIAIFLIGRVASSIVGTYVLVISPNYYLSTEEETR
jgi:hypothetical protein